MMRKQIEHFFCTKDNGLIDDEVEDDAKNLMASLESDDGLSDLEAACREGLNLAAASSGNKRSSSSSSSRTSCSRRTKSRLICPDFLSDRGGSVFAPLRRRLAGQCYILEKEAALLFGGDAGYDVSSLGRNGDVNEDAGTTLPSTTTLLRNSTTACYSDESRDVVVMKKAPLIALSFSSTLAPALEQIERGKKSWKVLRDANSRSLNGFERLFVLAQSGSGDVSRTGDTGTTSSASHPPPPLVALTCDHVDAQFIRDTERSIRRRLAS
ncbi:unnamed protein product [Amoebophrya sp. A25]|nr:unnamed protein product [Amoebophrya sp. A25]|eukprot:GSA25T00002792001.1